MKDGVIVTIRLNESVTLTVEYEGDLINLFEKIDDISKTYNKVLESRYPYTPLYRKIWSKMF